MATKKTLNRVLLNPTQQRMWKVFVFLIRLLILSIPLYAILSFSGLLLPLQYAVTGNTFWLLSSAGYAVSQDGTALTISGGQPFTFFITEDCTGWKSMLLFSALVFAVSGIAMKKRATALIIALPLIWAGNIARILIIVGIQQAYGTGAAMFFHGVLWQAGLITLVMGLWLAWLLRFSGYVPGKPDIRANNINQEKQD